MTAARSARATRDADGPIVLGPYAMANKTLVNPSMDSTDRRIDVHYPVGGSNGSFPLIAYAHGFTNNATDYLRLFTSLVSFGYVVISPWACFRGCVDDE